MLPGLTMDVVSHQSYVMLSYTDDLAICNRNVASQTLPERTEGFE